MNNLHRIGLRRIDYWLSGDGQLIPITELTNAHIHNIIWAYRWKEQPNRPKFWKHSKERRGMLENVYKEMWRRKYAKLNMPVMHIPAIPRRLQV